MAKANLKWRKLCFVSLPAVQHVGKISWQWKTRCIWIMLHWAKGSHDSHPHAVAPSSLSWLRTPACFAPPPTHHLLAPSVPSTARHHVPVANANNSLRPAWAFLRSTASRGRCAHEFGLLPQRKHTPRLALQPCGLRSLCVSCDSPKPEPALSPSSSSDGANIPDGIGAVLTARVSVADAGLVGRRTSWWRLCRSGTGDGIPIRRVACRNESSETAVRMGEDGCWLYS
jgi:hypothetical protein